MQAGLHSSRHLESETQPRRNLEASVRSHDTDGAERSDRDLIEGG